MGPERTLSFSLKADEIEKNRKLLGNSQERI